MSDFEEGDFYLGCTCSVKVRFYSHLFTDGGNVISDLRFPSEFMDRLTMALGNYLRPYGKTVYSEK